MYTMFVIYDILIINSTTIFNNAFFVVVLIDVLPFTMKVFIHKLNTFKLNDNLIDLSE